MAEIFAFPAGAPAATRPGDDAGKQQRLTRPRGVPDDVWAAVESVDLMPRLRGVRYREIPVSSTLADFGIGVELEADDEDVGLAFSGTGTGSGASNGIGPSASADTGAGAGAGMGAGFRADADTQPHHATGWLMLLYARTPRVGWDSCWRCVAFARLPLEESEDDPLAPGMYWDAMCDYVEYTEPDSMAGTVTVTRNTVFGALSEAPSAGAEIRVSWTPLDGTGPDGTMDAGAQINSWAAFIRSTVRPEEDDCS